MTTISTPQQQHVQEEGVLRDVLDELDKERKKRAELEAKVRALEAQQEERSGKHKLLALQYQVDGYQQVIHALTESKPALSAANVRQCTIPIHILRLLEIIPWDARAHEFIFQDECLYEWQIYFEDQWQTQLRYFPAAIRNLPLVKSTTKSTITASRSSSTSGVISTHASPMTPTRQHSLHSSSNRDAEPTLSKHHHAQSDGGGSSDSSSNLLAVLAGANSTTSKPRFTPPTIVMTDMNVSKLYHTPNDDYMLPALLNGGTWEWVNVWHVGEHAKWVYGSTVQQVIAELQHAETLNTALTRHDNPEVSPATRLLRGRRWTRRRVLVEYPNMCHATKAYLHQLASSTQRGAHCQELSQQLTNTQTTLSETRECLKIARAQLHESRRLLQHVVVNRSEAPSEQQQEQLAHETELIIEFLAQSKLAVGAMTAEDQVGEGHADDSSFNEATATSAKRPLRGRQTHASLPGSSHHSESASVIPASSTSSTGSSDLFDWKRLGRGALMDRIKLSQVQQQQH
ncbi:hypothetical protein MPSEU_000446200 [Mayamaea pseudoterrestris]|nr:hypothetical protein MPSEU_000446200 [Mayamaea pseudoterrestris]